MNKTYCMRNPLKESLRIAESKQDGAYAYHLSAVNRTQCFNCK